MAAGEDVMAPLAHDDGGAGVLAHGQHAGRGDVGVLQKLEGDEAVVVRCFRVVEDLTQLGEVPGPQQVRDVVKGFLGQQRQRAAVYLEDLAPPTDGRDVIAGDLAIGSRSAASGNISK